MSYEDKGSSTPTEQSSLAGAIISEEEKLRQAKKAEMKKKYRNMSMILVGIIVVAVVLLLVQWNSGPPEQLEWSEWMDVLPDYATDEFYNIEEQTLYRIRNLETTSSTNQSEMAGWVLYDTVEGNGEFGAWSDWSASEVIGNENREIETQTRYHYRDKETTSSSESTMSGWELADTTYTWGEYGGWSSWSTSAVSDSDSRKVETQTQYRFRDKETTTSGSSSLNGWTLYDEQHSYSYGTWSDWGETPITNSETIEVISKTEYTYTWDFYYDGVREEGARFTSPWEGNGPCPYTAGQCIYGNTREDGVYVQHIVVSVQSKTLYAYRSKTLTSSTYYFYRWTNWSSWSNVAVSSSNTRDVQSRTRYRYCDREQLPTYHFWRWGGWTDWSVDEVSATDNRQVETTLYYRYRDRQLVTTYYFQRWGDWSDYSKTPATSSDTTEVERIKQYRFKSKDN